MCPACVRIMHLGRVFAPETLAVHLLRTREPLLDSCHGQIVTREFRICMCGSFRILHLFKMPLTAFKVRLSFGLMELMELTKY